MATETLKQYFSRIGKMGAKARNAKMTPRQRKASARKANQARLKAFKVKKRAA